MALKPVFLTVPVFAPELTEIMLEYCSSDRIAAEDQRILALAVLKTAHLVVSISWINRAKTSS